MHAVSMVRVEVCVRARAWWWRGGEVGTGLSIMVCPLRGNYAESCVSVGGGGRLLWDVCPLCVFVRMLAKRCL